MHLIMHHGVATKKVVGGKLLRVKTVISPDAVVESVQLTGDFFLHPEDAVGVLEKTLTGFPIDSNRAVFLEKLNSAIHESGAQLIGFSPEDIIDTFLESAKSAVAPPSTA